MLTVFATARSLRLRLLASMLTIGTGVSLAGCSGDTPGPDRPRGNVTIKVTYGGAPVTEGQVDLESPGSGEGGGGTLNNEGVATIPNVAEGSYTVTVVPPPPDPRPPEPGETPPPVKEYPNIPQKFRMLNTSPLRVEVKKGQTQEFTFDLQKEE